MKGRVRVLVVDDSAFSRQSIRKMLEGDPEIDVVGVATDGVDAMSKAMKLEPDLITLDFEMPEMDGFGFLRWLMQHKPIPVIMVSSHSETKTVFQALELGAIDFIVKPSSRASIELLSIEKDLRAKVKSVENMNMAVLSRNLKRLEEKSGRAEGGEPSRSDIGLVAIGSSTGGPPALQLLLSGLPADFPSGIVISQHMPRGFTRTFAERLNKLVGLQVREARDGDEIEGGVALLCPGGNHMSLKKNGKRVSVELKGASTEDKYVPSVDVMMKSAAEQFGGRMLGVILTGMGNDGKDGMLEIKSRGGFTIAESEETAVVFGMPAEAIRAGSADKVLPLFRISREIIELVMGERRV